MLAERKGRTRLDTMGYTSGLSSVGGAGNKISKVRSKMAKPGLMKLSRSTSNSLDLDRGWDEQPHVVQWMGGGDQTFGDAEFSHAGYSQGVGRSARDVSFEIPGRSSLSLRREGVGSRASAARNTSASFHHHGRSLSGNSHHSVATSGSGGTRVGSFVHPFQQLPRTSTSTPPLGYAGSSTSFDAGTIAYRDYSPTITEYEDDDTDVGGASGLTLDFRDAGSFTEPSPGGPFRQSSQQSHHNSDCAAPNPALGKPRPSLGSHRTSSVSDITSTTTTTATLRGKITGRTTPTISSARLVSSKSDLQLNLSSSCDLPLNKTNKPPVLKSTKTAPVGSPTSSSAPMSPLRTSLDAIGIPRLRSHSEVDSAARQEQIRKARRKFEERERAKEEKYDREQVYKRDRRDTKEALKIEKKTQEWYKASGVSDSGGGIGLGVGSRNCSKANLSTSLAGTTILETPGSTSGRPSFSRKHTPTNLSSTFTASDTGSNPSNGAKVFGKRKGSSPGVGSLARSSSGLHDITTIRTSGGFDRADYANDGDAEKQQSMFAGNSYGTVPGQPPPMFGTPAYNEDSFAKRPQPLRMPSRKKQAKEKTQSTWHIFRMWFLSKIMRITRR